MVNIQEVYELFAKNYSLLNTRIFRNYTLFHNTEIMYINFPSQKKNTLVQRLIRGLTCLA